MSKFEYFQILHEQYRAEKFNHNFYENLIHENMTLRFKNALSSSIDKTKDYSFYNKSRFFKIEHITYVKNELNKRFYKLFHLLRLLHNRNRNSLY